MTDISETRYLIFVNIVGVHGLRRCGICHATVAIKRETDHALWHTEDFDEMHETACSLEADASVAVTKFTRDGETMWSGSPAKTERQKRSDEGQVGWVDEAPELTGDEFGAEQERLTAPLGDLNIAHRVTLRVLSENPDDPKVQEQWAGRLQGMAMKGLVWQFPGKYWQVSAYGRSLLEAAAWPVDPKDDPVWQAGYDAATSDYLDAREAEEAATVAYIAAKEPEIAQLQAISPYEVDIESLRDALVRVRFAFEHLQAASADGDEDAVARWDNHIDFASLILAMTVGKYLEARI